MVLHIKYVLNYFPQLFRATTIIYIAHKATIITSLIYFYEYFYGYNKKG